MKLAIAIKLALLAMLSLAMPAGAWAGDPYSSDWTKPDWAYKHPGWWQAYESKHEQMSPYADPDNADEAHFRYWQEHHRGAADESDYHWRWNCQKDPENCRANPYSYGKNFTPPDSLYYRQYNPSYGYVVPWSFYVTPYR
jgi:hypothetical protein